MNSHRRARSPRSRSPAAGRAAHHGNRGNPSARGANARSPRGGKFDDDQDANLLFSDLQQVIEDKDACIHRLSEEMEELQSILKAAAMENDEMIQDLADAKGELQCHLERYDQLKQQMLELERIVDAGCSSAKQPME